MITLYDFAASPHCVRVRAALALAGLRYRRVPMTLEGDQDAPAFRARTPFGTVPLLVDGKATVAQSYAALLWIGDRAPALVGSGAAKARVLTWLAAAATELDPPIRAAYDLAYFTNKPDPKQLRAAVSSVREMLDRVERARRAVGREPFIAGPRPTIADAAWLPSFWLLGDLRDDFSKQLPSGRWPFWEGWYARLRARPEIAAVLVDAEA